MNKRSQKGHSKCDTTDKIKNHELTQEEFRVWSNILPHELPHYIYSTKEMK